MRQDQYNYYPSRDPFADLTPDLQLQTVGQNRTLTNLGLRANLSYVKGMHNLKIGATYMDTILTEKDSYRDRRSHPQCSVSESRWKSFHGRVADGSGGMQRDAPAESQLHAAARLL